jgi:hypothetical protein
MNFGLRVSQPPHARESRARDGTVPVPPLSDQHKFAALWQRLKMLFS